MKKKFLLCTLELVAGALAAALMTYINGLKKIEELKLKIHQQVDQLQDETILQMLQEAIEAYTSPNAKDIIDELTPEQFSRLQQSIQQADNGETVTNEEVKKISRQWLPK